MVRQRRSRKRQWLTMSKIQVIIKCLDLGTTLLRAYGSPSQLENHPWGQPVLFEHQSLLAILKEKLMLLKYLTPFLYSADMFSFCWRVARIELSQTCQHSKFSRSGPYILSYFFLQRSAVEILWSGQIRWLLPEQLSN